MDRITQIFNLSAQKAVKLISPDSMAFHEENNKVFTISEFMESQALKQRIQAGDIVLTKTTDGVYGIARKLMGSEYDHVSVFLDKDTVLHISPPKVRIIPSNVFLMTKLSPFIIRPKLSDAERNDFVQRLKEFNNSSYDYKGLIQIFGLKTIKNILNIASPNQSYLLYHLDQAKRKKRKICTDLIIFSLAQSCQEVMNSLKRNFTKLNFSYVGAFSPDDVKFLAQKEPTLFKLVYPTEQDQVVQREKQRNDFIKKAKKQYLSQNDVNFEDSQKIRPSIKTINMEKRANFDKLVDNLTRLVTMAQVNQIFTKKYLRELKTRLDGNAYFQNLKFVFNLWTLKNFIFSKQKILENKMKFLVTVYQVYQALHQYNIVTIHFEAIYRPFISFILKQITSFFYPLPQQSL